jgi:adenine-specific DNA-methyltransferase
MTVRYIGSKARLVDAIMSLAGEPTSSNSVFVDAFCGTGVVAETAARAGWQVRINDHLECAVAMAHARLLSKREASFRQLGGYDKAIEQLNQVSSIKGFMWQEYSPASHEHAGVARMYFTEKNAARIDGIRKTIADWSARQLLTRREEVLLIADLLLATNRVANIAGTYGCFLSHWSSQSREALLVRPRELFPTTVAVETSIADVYHVSSREQDIVYFDPPYTKRQYAAYYHVLETITVHDEPIVNGITGLRPWQAKTSPFCYRTRALDAIVQLIEQQPARTILLSYSDQGHVALSPLSEALSQLGRLNVVPLKEVGRYRPNQSARDAGSKVTEYLLVLNRAKNKSRCAARI